MQNSNACQAQSVGEREDFTKEQRREILQILRELRDILKAGRDHPVVEVLKRFRIHDYSPRDSNALLQELAETNYNDCLVELICGRLRRLENQILANGEAASCEPTAPTAASGEGLCHEPIELTNKEILVVEDSEICAELAKNILQTHGFDVTVATTALDARDALERRPPALVLMDVHLADACGIELVKLMRRNSSWSDLPVIMVTSDRNRETFLEAIDVRVEGYLLKPYQPQLLVDKVTTVLARLRAHESHANAGGWLD